MKPISFEAVNRFARGEVRGSFSKPIRNRAGNKFVRGRVRGSFSKSFRNGAGHKFIRGLISLLAYQCLPNNENLNNMGGNYNPG